MPSVTARHAVDRLRGDSTITLLDVREPAEWDICNLHEYGARLMPLAGLAASIAAIDLSRTIFVHCKGGARSAKAVQQLIDAGARDVHNIVGGILAWSDEVDESKPRY